MNTFLVVWTMTTGLFGISEHRSLRSACEEAEAGKGQVFERVQSYGVTLAINCIPHDPLCGQPGAGFVPVKCAWVPDAKSEVVTPGHWEAL